MPLMLAPILNQSARPLRISCAGKAFLPGNCSTSKQIAPLAVATTMPFLSAEIIVPIGLSLFTSSVEACQMRILCCLFLALLSVKVNCATGQGI